MRACVRACVRTCMCNTSCQKLGEIDLSCRLKLYRNVSVNVLLLFTTITSAVLTHGDATIYIFACECCIDYTIRIKMRNQNVITRM